MEINEQLPNSVSAKSLSSSIYSTHDNTRCAKNEQADSTLKDNLYIVYNTYDKYIIQSSPQISNSADDEDDEFGGASFNVAAYQASYAVNVGATDNTADDEDDEDEDEDEEVETIPDDIGCFPNLNKDIPVNSTDEDDEFGGASFDVTAYQANQAVNADAIVNTADDEGDEFGGASFDVEAYQGKGVQTDVEIVSDEDVLILDYPLIAAKGLKSNQYLIDGLTDIAPTEKSIYIPLVIDTEFYTETSNTYQQTSRTPLTVQIKGINSDAPGIIYALHPSVNVGRELVGLKPFLTPSTMFYPLDYLRDVGEIDIEIREAKPSEIRRRCYIVLYAHFATAEINLIATDTVKQQIKQLQRGKGEQQITAGRRLFCQHVMPDMTTDTVSLKHIITINKMFEYELFLKVVDTGAIHGIAGYGDVAKAVGYNLLYKDNFSSVEKGRMLAMAVERTKDFEDYAMGDLGIYEILKQFNEQWKLVYEKLGLTPYYREPKLTIGGTVKDLFEASLANYFQITPEKWNKNLTEIINNFIQPGSADELRKWTNFTRAILSKVEGGRCRNNRPTELSLKSEPNTLGLWENPICDIDISGCYGEGQRNQDYPIGKPEIFDYKVSKNNDYITLRKWLISYGVQLDTLIKAVENNDSAVWNNQENWGELLSGLWQARMSNSAPLKYSQDFFASWFMESSHGVDMLAKSLKEMKSDTELQTTENIDFDEDTGNLKVFNNDIKNGVLTHDGLQWILAVASKRQRNELLDNLTITSSAVYCASDKIDVTDGKNGLEKLTENTNNWTGKNTTQRIKNEDGKTSIMMNFREYHGWFSVNLGELLVDSLLIERKKAQIIDGKKSPLDVLFKLCVNTLYGDMVSKFFVTSNPVVGNNITARARALAWYMEKGLHGHQPITDGCAFELNGVLFQKTVDINGECVNLHREDSKLAQRNIKKGSLSGKPIFCKWVDTNLLISGDSFNYELIEWINNKPFLTVDGNQLECDKEWIEKVRKDRSKKPINLKSLKLLKKPILIIDDIEIEKGAEWIDRMAMLHLQNIFNLIDVLHRPSASLNVDKQTLKVIKQSRIGQFSFETKDIYYSGCFHGSANYLLENPNGQTIKARGYETKREHTGIELDPEQDKFQFLKSTRYGAKNNPAKDLMKQLLENPENITRQIPAIKSGILKVGDYKNLADKYDELGIEPGDNILKPVLMQEFSLSQFTFQTYEQYISWKKVIEKAKMKQKQSLEGYFLNENCTLNLQALCEWVDGAIASGVMNPFDELKDKNRHDRRTEKTVKAQSKKTETRGKPIKNVVTISHPHLETLNSLREQLNNPPD